MVIKRSMDIMFQLSFFSTLHHCETVLSSEGKQAWRYKSSTNQSSEAIDCDWMSLLPCLRFPFIALHMTSFSVMTEPHFNTRKQVPPKHAHTEIKMASHDTSFILLCVPSCILARKDIIAFPS